MHPPADRVTESLSTLELGKMDSAEYSDIFSLLKGVLVSDNNIVVYWMRLFISSLVVSI